MGLDDFEVLGELGRGAFGIVSKVRRIADNTIYALKKVCVKRMSQKDKENTLNEIRILSSVCSPFVIGYKEAFYDDKSSSICIILEFADGGQLCGMIKEKKEQQASFTEDVIWKTAYQLLKGLKKLHQGKVLHRDIKPANILFCKGQAKLSDMNISKFTQQGAAVTQTGTPYYRCPQIWSDETFTQKGDIWSFGCVIYEMVVLEVPFKARMVQALYVKISNGIYELPQTCPKSLATLIKKCLVVDPIKRPSVEDLLMLPEFKKFSSSLQNKMSVKMEMKSGIEIPQNLKDLNRVLPQSNYDSNSLEKCLSSQTKLNVKQSILHLKKQKRSDSSMRKSSSKFLKPPRRSTSKSKKTVNVTSVRFIELDEVVSKPLKQLTKSSKLIKSMKKII